mgnify:FL=1
MAYKQKNNPFYRTECGRRYGPLNQMIKGDFNSPFAQTNKKTKGKGRHFRSKEEGAGMTKAGVASYKKQNPGSKLKTAVTGKPSTLGPKAAARRKSFCARSKSWTGERGKAARARWNC